MSRLQRALRLLAHLTAGPAAAVFRPANIFSDGKTAVTSCKPRRNCRSTWASFCGFRFVSSKMLGIAATMLEQPDEGSILFEGRDISAMNGRERLAMRSGFQLLLQIPTTACLRTCPLAARLGWGLRSMASPQGDRRTRA